ncbi:MULTISPECIES: PaaI family thioesterase [unclassified Acinetobacter]|uniref:PaaI family thioesterase n=1 Tax=unclassified Acinetobacter TaxID=196816 RepID=UPI002934920C|nr:MULTISPECIES: hotdog domain-containing protein [unclassified Acinetobacter]WOE32490.1 hotdog domain-containing protein [Acinetobacter sp. SAAs470]WOE37966.1 hotdog domain-containing protein [Acinetobacter sp. SAAs474]
MTKIAFQDLYAEDFSHCFGCGRNNQHGYHLKSYWSDDMTKTFAKIIPANIYTGGVPDHLYGGMIASLFDCHGMASAAAFKSKSLNLIFDGSTYLARCVTASLSINFIKPTPIDTEILIYGELISIEERKIRVGLSLLAAGQLCATGEILAIELKK